MDFWVYGKDADGETPICYAWMVDWDSFKAALNDKRAGDMIRVLERTIASLGTAPAVPGDLRPTTGESGAMLQEILTWARRHPDGTFVVR